MSWGSIFSFQKVAKFTGKLPRQIPYPVTVSYGEPMPPEFETPYEVRAGVVVALGAAAWEERKRRIPTVGSAFVAHCPPRASALRLRRLPAAPSMSFIGALSKGAISLAGRPEEGMGQASRMSASCCHPLSGRCARPISPG